MKKNLRSLLFTCISLFFLILVVSFILSSLYFFNIFISSLSMISKVAGFLIFLICGFLLGKNIKEKTFFYALGFALIGFLLSLIFVEKSLLTIILLLSKWCLFVIVALFARSI